MYRKKKILPTEVPRVCRVCKCTDASPCAGGCSWVEEGLCSACATPEGREYRRIVTMIRTGEIENDSTLIIFSTDGLLQFSRADLIPWFYETTEPIEDLLERVA